MKQLSLIGFAKTLLLPIASLISACSSMPSNSLALNNTPSALTTDARASKSAMNPVRLSMQSGADALLAGDAKLANHEFNLAIARDLKNPALHAANALAYQIRTRAGERDLFDLAETGYLVALEQQHDFQQAAVQLAHLYLENKRYAQAQRAAAYALKLESKNVEALHLLASASYSLGDVELSLWALEQARLIAPNDKYAANMVPAIYGEAGLNDQAEAYINENPTLWSQQGGEQVKRRLEQWNVAYATDQAKTDEAKAGSDDAGEKASANTPAQSDSQGPLVYAWSDCAQALTPNAGAAQASSSDSSDSSTVTRVDETMVLPSLPSPCKSHAMPQMAIIDVVILRTNELNASSTGINLLENLAVTIQQSSNKVSTSIDNAPSTSITTLTTNIGLGTSAGGAIAYSLNIANVSGQTTEVVSRPSLQVLDRQAAQFFSGSKISIGLTGGVNSSSTLSEVNVGLSLSVTPTFIDEQQMLLNVRAAHTFFEPVTGTSTFNQSLQTSRNMVAAATKIRINETLVLSGLTEREAISGSSGVPLLKDIPGVQYFFSKRSVQNFNKTVLILITPRRMVAYGETLDQVQALDKASELEPKLMQETRQRALNELGGRWPNLYHAIRHMSRSERAFGVRTKDIELEDWNRPQRVQKILQDAVSSLYL
ncbi:Type II/III secretion system [Methylophilaceae bacterium]